MNILTFDIEDWYNCDFISENFDWDNYEVRIYEGVHRILDELDRKGLKGTFFCLGWLAEKHPAIIKEIDNRGHEVGCHSYQHQLASRFSKDGFVKDTMKAKHLLEDVIGKEVDKFRAPGFSITHTNKWALEKLVTMGFGYDASIFPAEHDYGGMPGYGEAKPKLIILEDGRTIKEFPINTKSLMGKKLVFSGGGFFRLFNYPIIKRWTAQSEYVMTYFHPRDFDAEQPVIKELPRVRRFKSYVGISTAFAKFQKYMNDFDFIDIATADKLIDWEKAEKIKISELVSSQ